MRIETGPYKPPGDWTGIFIRGDEATGFYSIMFKFLAERETDPRLKAEFEHQIKLFQSCRE